MYQRIAAALLLGWGGFASAVADVDEPEQATSPTEQKQELHSSKPFGIGDDATTFIPFIDGEMTVDGTLNESQWLKANRLSLGFVTRPFENTAAPVKTDVLIFEDGDNLHVAFIASDPDPAEISAFYRDRDRIWSDDLVGVKLDTFNNERLAYQFFVNPLGVQADAIENEMTGNESDSWNAIWESAGKITDTGYVVEMAIPLRTLNFKEGERSKTWGAEFVRFYPREDRLRLSNLPLDRNNACILCQMGDVEGFESATQSDNLAIVPTVVLGKGKTRDPFETREWDDTEATELGLDLKWGITPQVSLQATLNPDFSQVEADVAQVSINNTFSLYFDERRPFFVENAGYFSTNQTLVYTRNIATPDYGAKLTGQMGDHTFGAFVADDQVTRFIVPGNLSSSVAEINSETVNAAFRYRYDVSNDLSIGMVSTLRDADEYHNYVNGVDAKYRITSQDTLRAQYVISDTQYPFTLYQDFCDNDCINSEDSSETAIRTRHDEAFSGSSWRVNYIHEERDWFVRADHYANDSDFRADLGFETKADFHKSVFGGGYMWWNDKSWWNRIRINGDWDISHNDNGELLERELEAYISIRGTMQSFVELGHVKRERVGLRFDPAELRVDGNTSLFEESSTSLYVESRPSPFVFFNTFVRSGDQIDFANNRLGEQLYTESQLDMNLGKHTQVRLRHTYSDLDVEDVQLFTARLSDIRVTYQFDPRQFVRLIAAYTNIHRNTDNYDAEVEPLTRSFGLQLLYSYKVNPLTKFFVGVASSGIQEAPLQELTESEKSVFMKLSYAWLQ